MNKDKKGPMTMSLFLVITTTALGITSSNFFETVYAAGDKVKVECTDVAITLATLALALGDLDKDSFNQLEDELQEGEIANSVDEIRDNFQNVVDKVNDKCEDVDFVGFVDFEEPDFVG
jgi:hypothetical protein